VQVQRVEAMPLSAKTSTPSDWIMHYEITIIVTWARKYFNRIKWIIYLEFFSRLCDFG
jgi:hypothetical protein